VSFFTFHLKKHEKSRYLCNSSTDPRGLARWCRTCVSRTHCSWDTRPLKNFTLKIQDGGRPIRLRDPFCIIMSIAIFKMAAVPHLGILKLKVLTAGYFRDTFWVFTLSVAEIGRTVAEISHFVAFFKWSIEFTRRSRLMWHNFVKVRNNWITFSNFA